MKFKQLLNESVQFTVNILDKKYRYDYSKRTKIIGEITNFLNRKLKTNEDLNKIEEIIKSKPKFDFESFKNDILKMDYKITKPSEEVYVPIEIEFKRA